MARQGFVVAGAVAVAALGMVAFGARGGMSQQSIPQKTLKEERVLVGKDGRRMTVEVAGTEEQRAIGLMARPSMARDHGMIFVWPSNEPRSFWMKNTILPLDMVFIRRGGEVATVHAGAVPYSEDSVDSGVPVSAVLEVDAGVAQEFGIVPGSRVVLDRGP